MLAHFPRTAVGSPIPELCNRRRWAPSRASGPRWKASCSRLRAVQASSTRESDGRDFLLRGFQGPDGRLAAQGVERFPLRAPSLGGAESLPGLESRDDYPRSAESGIREAAI